MIPVFSKKKLSKELRKKLLFVKSLFFSDANICSLRVAVVGVVAAVANDVVAATGVPNVVAFATDRAVGVVTPAAGVVASVAVMAATVVVAPALAAAVVAAPAVAVFAVAVIVVVVSATAGGGD